MPAFKIQAIRIVFICSSLEPGKDGVGDYTRKLACTLNNRGSEARIIAINDRRLNNASVWEGTQNDEGTKTEVLRLASVLTWNERVKTAKAWISNYNPDWVSLQYVPFGFHLKGLPFNLANNLLQLSSHQRWHIMFHELSVNKDESLKFKIWSWLQVNIIKSLIKNLQPTIIHTNTELYKHRLKEMGFDATVLPLFSNISSIETKNEDVYNNIIPSFIRLYQNDYLIGTLFGSFDCKRWDMRSLLNKFKPYSFNKKRAVLVSIGKMSSGVECWEQLKLEYPQVIFLSLGEQSSEFISHWLSGYTDFGILTTLPELAGKSGSFMAFKEHGIPVVCKEETASLRSFNLPVEKGLVEVTSAKEFQLPSKQKPVAQLQLVTNMFITALEGAQLKTQNSLEID